MVVADEHLAEQNQKYDLLLEFSCPDRWLVRMAKKPTHYLDYELTEHLRLVDSKTCKPLTDNTTYIEQLEKE